MPHLPPHLIRLALLFAFVLLLFATQGPAGGVSAATFAVDSTADAVDALPGDGLCDDGGGSCTLRAAIQETNSLPGPDTITLPAGTYTLAIPGTNEDAAATGDLDISDDLTLTGAGQAATVIDGGGLDRVFHGLGGVNVYLSSIAIQNGAADSGGGIDVNVAVTLTLTNVTVSGNSATAGAGGGINVFGVSELTLDSVNINNNTASEGGGIASRDGKITLANSTVSDNTATTLGGGGIMSDAELSITNTSVRGNSAAGFGGGISYSAMAGPGLTLSKSVIEGNSADGNGGGIENMGVATVADSEITNNTAANGGGIGNEGPFANLHLTTTSVNHNSATSDGAGIYNWGRGDVNSLGTTISQNTASRSGGGIFNTNAATLVLANNTISGNKAALLGGGVFNDSELTLSNDTVNSNAAATGGGIGSLNPTGAILNSTIISSNSGGDCSKVVEALVTAGFSGHNLSSDDTCDFTGSSDLVSTDPLLGPLADNGGPTKTHALLAGSPAVDAGDATACPATDQRGVARPIDGDRDGAAVCDIGAFEAAEGTSLPPTPAPASFPVTGGQPADGDSARPLAVTLAVIGLALAGGVLAAVRRR